MGWRKSRVVRLILNESLALAGLGLIAGIPCGIGLMFFMGQWHVTSSLVQGGVSLATIGKAALMAAAMAAVGALLPALRSAGRSARPSAPGKLRKEVARMTGIGAPIRVSRCLSRFLWLAFVLIAVGRAAAADAPTLLVLKPARVFDGVSDRVHKGWIVIVDGERIAKPVRSTTSRFPRASG